MTTWNLEAKIRIACGWEDKQQRMAAVDKIIRMETEGARVDELTDYFMATKDMSPKEAREELIRRIKKLEEI